MSKLKSKIDVEALRRDIERIKNDEVSEEELAEIMAKYEAALKELEAGEKDPFASLKDRKRLSFMEKLEQADDDLREKFNGLREYILAYGVKEREMIPGVGFYSGRNRVIFITMAGKKLKAHYALNHSDYENSKIPVEDVDSKKYVSTPLAIRIQSDLSYRRARKLVDDVMLGLEIEKPEEMPETGIKFGGKYEIFPEAGWFKYRLKANNGQILIVSNAYKSKDGAKNGIETLKKNMVSGTHRVITDKNGYGQFRIYTENDSRMVVAGEIYPDEAAANRALESALRFFSTDKIVVLDEIPESERREWEAELPEANPLNGKLELLVDEEEQWTGKLLAMNGEILFVTQAYSSKSGLFQGIENIKDRVNDGNVTISCDKQGRYQFRVLSDNGMVLVMGETYPSKENALSAAVSMKNFLAGEYKIIEPEKAE